MRLRMTLAILVAAASSVEAAPVKHVFRELQSHELWHTTDNPDELLTFTITIDGERVSVTAESATRDGKGWKKGTTQQAEGRLRTTDGATTLAMGEGADAGVYKCTQMKVDVAAATARRVKKSVGEGALGGAWTSKLTKVSALVCTSELGAAPLPPTVVLASRPIEHVIADDNCCENPGDSLRAIPANRSVQPLSR